MPSSVNTVFIVEDDQSVRDALGLLLGLQGLAVTLFADAESFLAARRADWYGCLLLDIRMPGMDGLSLQKRLAESGCLLPVIVMTGHGDVESARQAFRSDAVDFLEKPIDHDRLLAAITEAFARQHQRRDDHDRHASAAARLAGLTPREREVMALVVAGRHNREIAQALDISPRTVEVHKARLLAKLQVGSIADLVRLSLQVSGQAAG
ncbi:response regulator [Accumulibacter sp.]|uniref:response regulator transcription factor n=1 Tax=Accumulibacter sp. TaxID=2053492 RepID=UPI0028794D33|nr:response regulator [Accumulibacter sp.]MDS4055928.1 response regulator [Accumulibacter sp.]HMX67433.1 response regulator [Accumulibacter sp.]HNC25898.1 response regulator [Accumulibacter sp.]HNH90857.1 response regulator [Accumulibacter sp.]HNI50440.1 response regulator [Accumulibacter sp.]